MFGEEDGPRKKTMHEIGEDLSLVSVEELRERVKALKAEIERIESEIAAKDASRSAADQAFKI
jgi:uncharacterized small protein (DUF1192 family)